MALKERMDRRIINAEFARAAREALAKLKVIKGTVRPCIIAHRLGTRPGYISRILSGREYVTLRNMVHIACALGYEIQISFVRKEVK